MNSKSVVIKDILLVSGSNIVKLFAGILIGFLLPRIVGITDYGYYKTFTLYATYVGLFHFGLSDGIYLKYGGVDYEKLDKHRFCFYTRVFLGLETLIAILLIVVSCFVLNGEYKFIFVCLSVYLIFHNLVSYYQSISQITSRFKELSTRNLLESSFNILTILVLLAIHYCKESELSYRTYTLCYLGITVILALWYAYTYRGITFGGKQSNWNDIKFFIVTGFPLMVANLCSSLILTLDRQFVNLLFTTDEYAVYAFAYNMLSLVTTATSAIAMVLYPNLKKISKDTLKESYPSLVSTILILMFLSMVIYFPLCIFVGWFLPKYIGSLIIFRIIFPGLAISSVITIVMHNYYKVLGDSTKFFIKCLIALAISAIANCLAYYIFKTTIAISIASIITMIIWYVYVEFYFVKKYRIRWKKNITYMIVMMLLFYLVTCINNYYLGLAFYVVFFLVMTLLFYRKQITDIVKNKKVSS